MSARIAAGTGSGGSTPEFLIFVTQSGAIVTKSFQ